MDNTPTKTAMMELIEWIEKKISMPDAYSKEQILSFIVFRNKATELLEKEKTQIVESHIAIVKAGLLSEGNYSYSSEDERLIREQAETYFNETYKQ